MPLDKIFSLIFNSPPFLVNHVSLGKKADCMDGASSSVFRHTENGVECIDFYARNFAFTLNTLEF